MLKGIFKMKRSTFSFVTFGLLSLVFAINSFAQSQTFNDPNVEYTFDIPETIWKMIIKPSASNPNVEYAYGDRLDGHLEIRKVSVKESDTLAEIILNDQEQKLQFLPGYVAGKEEAFSGTLKGKVFNYEYVRSGKPMSGRFYYLKSDATTVYILRFTGLQEKLRFIRNQVDSIARTFKLKSA